MVTEPSSTGKACLKQVMSTLLDIASSHSVPNQTECSKEDQQQKDIQNIRLKLVILQLHIINNTIRNLTIKYQPLIIIIIMFNSYYNYHSVALEIHSLQVTLDPSF